MYYGYNVISAKGEEMRFDDYEYKLIPHMIDY